jgi:hypothetical protein
VGEVRLLAPGFHVVRVAEAVHRLFWDLTTVLAGAKLSAEARARVAAVVGDAAHGRRPAVDNDGLRSGGWVDAVARHVEPLAADLARVVAQRPADRVTGVVLLIRG